MKTLINKNVEGMILYLKLRFSQKSSILPGNPTYEGRGEPYLARLFF